MKSLGRFLEPRGDLGQALQLFEPMRSITVYITRMRIPVSIFDFAAYTIPGVLYLAWLLAIADATQLAPNVWLWLQNPSLVHIAGALLVAYLLGHATYSLSRFHLPWERASTVIARENFRARSPSLGARPFVSADIFLLMAAIEAHNASWAASIASTQATSLMCRNTATPLFGIAATVAITHPAQRLPTSVAIALAVCALLMRRAGNARAVWARTKTLECAAWIAGIDAPFSPASTPPATPAATNQLSAASADTDDGLTIEPT